MSGYSEQEKEFCIRIFNASADNLKTFIELIFKFEYCIS